MALVEFQTDNDLVLGRLRFKPLRQIAGMFWRSLQGCMIWSNHVFLRETENNTTFRVGFTLLSGWLFGTKSGKYCICSYCSQMQKVDFTSRKHQDWGAYNRQRKLVFPCPVLTSFWRQSHNPESPCLRQFMTLWGSAWFLKIQTFRVVSFIEMCSLELQTF